MPKFDPKEPPKYGQVWSYNPPESTLQTPIVLICKVNDYGGWSALSINHREPFVLNWAGIDDNPEQRLPGWERLA